MAHFALLFHLFCATSFAGKAFPPPPQSYVYDEPHLLSESAKQTLFATLSAEDQKSGNQILVAIFNSSEGEDPVDYTNRLLKNWAPGQKGKNNGVIIAAFLKEHQLRIEVGYGLEPVLTDAKSKALILNDLTPAFRAQNYDAGIIHTVRDVLHIIHPEATGADSSETDATQSIGANDQSPFLPWVLPGILFVLFFFNFLNRRFGSRSFGSRSRGGFWLFGGGGGGFGGFGGGGGGFGGGGGSSGGGGASGGW